MELRDYQKEQIKFLDFNTNNTKILFYERRLFLKKISLQSPTGSGKTFVAMSFIRDLFRKYPNSGIHVFFATGFNNLVFQAFEEAKKLGINSKVFIGLNNSNCKKRFLEENKRCNKQEQDYYIEKLDKFDLNPKYRKSDSKTCEKCKFFLSKDGRCFYYDVLSDLTKFNKEPENTLIITNHSSLLYHNKNVFNKNNFIGGFIDECHTFENFYEDHNSVEIQGGKFKQLTDTLQNVRFFSESPGVIEEANEKFLKIDAQIKTGNLNSQTVMESLNFLDGQITSSIKNNITNYKEFKRAVTKWANITSKKNYEYYETPQKNDEGVFTGVRVVKFFNKVDLAQDSVCLMSATVDNYTKNLFSITTPTANYVETSFNEFDYTKSSIRFYDEFNEDNIRKFVNAQTGDHGLILSTRLTDVVEISKMKNICGYNIIRNPDLFVKGKKQILVGSRRLFQGIDIRGLSFIGINKIPFEKYDVVYKKKMNFLREEGINNTFKDYTIPSTINVLIQTTGRLWRTPGDYGNLAIFDRESCKKHWGTIISNVLSYRDGIEVIVD